MKEAVTVPDGRQAALDRRSMVLGGLLFVGGGLAMARQPRLVAPPVSSPTLRRLIPDRVGEWTYQMSSGLVLPPSDALSDRLYDGLVTKVYAAPGRASIMLLVAYSNKQDGMLQVHRPEVCYPAGGYALSPTRHVRISDGSNTSISANAFAATSISRTEQVLYWIRVGRRFPSRWIDQRLAVVEDNLAGAIPDGVLVRISNFDADLDEALPEMSAFATALLRHTGPMGRRLLVGSDA